MILSIMKYIIILTIFVATIVYGLKIAILCFLFFLMGVFFKGSKIEMIESAKTENISFYKERIRYPNYQSEDRIEN